MLPRPPFTTRTPRPSLQQDPYPRARKNRPRHVAPPTLKMGRIRPTRGLPTTATMRTVTLGWHRTMSSHRLKPRQQRQSRRRNTQKRHKMAATPGSQMTMTTVAMPGWCQTMRNHTTPRIRKPMLLRHLQSLPGCRRRNTPAPCRSRGPCPTISTSMMTTAPSSAQHDPR